MALSPDQIAQLAYNAGFRGSALRMAVAIALAESGGNPQAYNSEAAAGTRPGHGSRGLWQIYGTAHPQYDNNQAFDPRINAQAAYSVYREAGNRFTPWSTFNNGSAYSIARSLNVNLPTSQVIQSLPSAVGAGGPALLSGLGGGSNVQTSRGGTRGATTTTTKDAPGIQISLLPEPVNQALSNIASLDAKKLGWALFIGGTGFVLFLIGALILIAQVAAPVVEEHIPDAVEAAKLAAAVAA